VSYVHHARADGRMKPSERIKLGALIRQLFAEGLNELQVAERLRISRHLVARFRRKS
jgi:hypothetical protein